MSDTPTKTLRALALEALAVQDASNLSGVVHGFGRALSDLRRHLEAEPGFGTDRLNQHPVAVVWADKVASLVGTQHLGDPKVWAAFAAVDALAKAGEGDAP